MTSRQATELVRQNIGEKLSGNVVLQQTNFIHTILEKWAVPALVHAHDWSWKYQMVHIPIPAGTWEISADQVFGMSLEPRQYTADIQALIYATATVHKRVVQRTARWFFDHYPEAPLNERAHPDWFFATSGNYITFNCPTLEDSTCRFYIPRPFTFGLDDELPIHADRQMLLVAGATAWAFASLEQMSPAAPGLGSPADWWMTIFQRGVNQWWQHDMAIGQIETNLGNYQPRTGGGGPDDYWPLPGKSAG